MPGTQQPHAHGRKKAGGLFAPVMHMLALEKGSQNEYD